MKNRMIDQPLLLTMAKDYGTNMHNKVNHTYDGYSYDVHLRMVFAFAKKYQELFRHTEDLYHMFSVCWLHDVIEDCRISYNDLCRDFDETIAEAVYALTTEKGRTRKERAGASYYAGVLSNHIAHFVKLCDRLANIEYSIASGSKMLHVYASEMNEFERQLRYEPYGPMFEEMRQKIIAAESASASV